MLRTQLLTALTLCKEPGPLDTSQRVGNMQDEAQASTVVRREKREEHWQDPWCWGAFLRMT